MTDPSRQVPSAPADGPAESLAVSLSEIDALSRKAARGAGYEWGLAEEAGRAARWLAAHHCDGPAMLLALLREIDDELSRYYPARKGVTWTSPSGALCPVCTGAALSDCAAELDDGGAIRLPSVIQPAILLPFAALAARRLGRPLRLEIGGTGIDIGADGVSGDIEAVSGLLAQAPVTLRIATGISGAMVSASPSAFIVSMDCWRGLDRFAQRTYVPASEQSRASGAGSGLTDNE
jgi:hypothetical protein